MLQVVLFDIDGTLIQSGGAGEKAFANVCESEFGIPDGTVHLNFAGRTDPSIVRDFFTHYRIEPTAENFERFFAAYVLRLEQRLIELAGRVLPGVPSWLRDLQAFDVPPVVGLLTGNIRPGARLKLQRYGLWDHFRTGAYGDDHEDRNQVAVIARDRARKLLSVDLAGDQILVIGDTPRDIACAKAIGARSLAVATGVYSVAELREHAPTYAVDTLEQLSPEEICRE
jgi:phosphoglycolate phosphatase-like HAD superfamily hydrolase